MQKYLKRAIDMLSGLALTKSPNPSVIPPVHTKSGVSAPEAKYFHRVRPSALGINPDILNRMLKALEAERRANIHNIIVIKDGKAVLDVSAPGYDSGTYHLSHSMTKTITGIAIGYLVEERGLDLSAKIVDIFPEYETADKRFSDITVEHLLTMRTGVPFSELGTATDSEWTKTYFAQELSFAPGEEFHYNSLNSYILGRIVQRISGESLTSFIKSRLFDPLHIENFLWEKSPEGYEKAGFGLYMSAESWAKIGVMLLNMGLFEGKQVMPRSWILRSITERSIAPESTGAFNYGYHIWVSRTNDEFLLNGMLGQNVWICPKNNMVVAVNCGNSELFQGSPALDIIRAHLGADISLPEEMSKAERRAALKDFSCELNFTVKHFFERRHIIRPKAPLKGIRYLLGLKSATPFDENFIPLLGEYAFPDNNSGLLPLFVSVMQNNFGGGIERMAFSRSGESLIFSCTEGGIKRELEVGIYNFKTSIIKYGGEVYIVNAIAEAMEDEDRNPVFKLELIFPELPNSRLIKFTFKSGRLFVRMFETPNESVAETYLTSFTSGGKIGFVMGLLEKKLGENFLGRKLHEVFNPELLAISTEVPSWDSILLAENTLAREVSSRTTGALSALISKFVGDDKQERAEAKIKKEKRGGFFGLFGRRRRGDNEDSGDTDSGDDVIIDIVDSDSEAERPVLPETELPALTEATDPLDSI